MQRAEIALREIVAGIDAQALRAGSPGGLDAGGQGRIRLALRIGMGVGSGIDLDALRADACGRLELDRKSVV